jgi:hypothetical protein
VTVDARGDPDDPDDPDDPEQAPKPSRVGGDD